MKPSIPSNVTALTSPTVDCLLCGRSFDPSVPALVPRILLCGHSFCSDCCLNLPSGKDAFNLDSLQCPIDQQRTLVKSSRESNAVTATTPSNPNALPPPNDSLLTVLKSWIDSARVDGIDFEAVKASNATNTNTTSPSTSTPTTDNANNLWVSLNRRRQHPLCQLCATTERKEAIWWCRDCPERVAQLYCGSCFDSEHVTAVGKQHSRLNVAQRPPPTRKCDSHPTEAIRLFCMQDQKAICRDCKDFGPHSGHETIPLHHLAKECRQQLRTAYNSAMSQLKYQQSDSEGEWQMVTEAESAAKQAKAALSTHIQTIIDALRIREQQLINQIQQSYQVTCETIHAQRRRRVAVGSDLAAACLDAQQLLGLLGGGSGDGDGSSSRRSSMTMEGSATPAPVSPPSSPSPLSSASASPVNNSDQADPLSSLSAEKVQSYKAAVERLSLASNAVQQYRQSRRVISTVVALQLPDGLLTSARSHGSCSVLVAPQPPRFVLHQADTNSVQLSWLPPPAVSMSAGVGVGAVGGGAGTGGSTSAPTDSYMLEMRILPMGGGTNETGDTDKQSTPTSASASASSTSTSSSTSGSTYEIVYEGSSTSYHKVGLLPASRYEFRVRGRNGAGFSDWSHPSLIVSTATIGGSYVRKFGTTGNADGQLTSPYGLCVAANGEVYVADSSNRRIQVFRSDGTFVRKFGSSGSGDGQFGAVYSVTVSPINGEVYVPDYTNHRIQVFRPDGTFLRKFGSKGGTDGHFNGPSDVAVAPSGSGGAEVFVVDHLNNRVQVFRPDGTFLRKFGGAGIGAGQFSSPWRLTYADGELYVVELNNHRVQVFKTDGSFVRKFGSQGSADGSFAGPYGVVVANGEVYVTDYGNQRVQVFDQRDGRFLRKFGTPGAGDGQFSSPVCLALASAELYVCELGNCRIQVFH